MSDLTVKALRTALRSQTERIEELERFIRKVSKDGCGCVPCRGQCDDVSTVHIWKDEVQATAKEILEMR